MPERGSHTSAPSPVDASQRSKPQGPELKRCVCELILAPVCDRESLREVAGNQCTALCSGFRVEDLIPCPPNLSRAGPQVEPQEPGGPTCVEEADKVGRFAALAACEAVTESCEQILQEERARPLPLCKKEEVANCEAAAFDLVQADEALAACKSQITLNDKLSGCTAEQASSIFVTMVSIVCSLVADK